MAIQQRAFMHVKATGVIHIYDFLNLPTANCLAVFVHLQNRKGDVDENIKIISLHGVDFCPDCGGACCCMPVSRDLYGQSVVWILLLSDGQYGDRI